MALSLKLDRASDITAAPSLADWMLPRCTVVPKKNKSTTTWYQLSMTTTYEDKKSNLRKVEIGVPHPGNKGKKVLLLVGATGSGKSTLINGLINYLFGVNQEDPFRLQLISKESENSQTHSQTMCITAYTIHWHPSLRFPYSLVIIDTPGYGDTRGIDRDKVITSQIKQFFAMPSNEAVDQLDAVGFVCQSSLPRLTPTQKYIFDSILSVFGKDVAENIFPMMTFGDGNNPLALAAIKEHNIPFKSYFIFNNSVFAVNDEAASALETQINDKMQEVFYKMFWNLAENSFQEFLSQLKVVNSISLKLTRQVLDERHRLETLVENLHLRVKSGVNKLNQIRQEFMGMEEIYANLSANKNYKIKVSVPKTRKVQITESNRYVTNCLICGTTCHLNCVFYNDEDKKNCSAMENPGENATCQNCVKKCSWRQHYHRNYYYEEYIEIKEDTLDDLKKKYDQADSKRQSKETTIIGMVQAYSKVQMELLANVKEISDCCDRLGKIAMRPDPLSAVEYIDLMIQSNKLDNKPGWESRNFQLNKAKERAEMIKKAVAEGRNYNPCKELEDEIYKAVNKGDLNSQSLMQKVRSFLGSAT